MASPEDAQELDGCDVDMVEHADDDETAALRALFPDGDPSTRDEWHELKAAGLLEGERRGA